MRVFLDETKICIDRPSKSDDPPSVSGLIQLTARAESVRGFPGGSGVKNPPAMQEAQV